ncbi:MAG: hypothetical protein GY910_21425 [bacterium]|nr:hypothetical protein [Deltaproteobacteria bacterium]MCP4907542.1 hypothetical protein [bacterium]
MVQKLSLDYSIEKREEGGFEAVDQFLGKLDLTWEDLEQAELEATAWSNRLTTVNAGGEGSPQAH